MIDSKGCYAQGSINITSDGGPQVSLIDLSHNDCYGGKNGKIDISVSGGLQPYSILWSNGETSEDIDSLVAGIYNVTVTADDKCLGAGSFQVFQPSQIAISAVETPATCEGSDGSAVAVVSGGTKPYTYNWSSGGIYQIEEGLAAGVYSVTVTDGKGCKMVEPVLVNDIGAPKVAISGLQGVGCTVIDNGSINITVTPPSITHNYSWSTDDGSGVTVDSKNQTGLTQGTYKVTVTNTQGCKGVSQAMVIQEPPKVNPICIVSVDTVTGKNMIVWEKLVTEDVSHYNIYRESSVKGDYQVIASVGFNEESLYIDSVADPTIRSWRYRLSVVDDCGNESELSDPHKTMHLTMNVGLDESVNLIWDHYEGFPISTYEIWRYDAASNWTNISNMPSNLTSYTDPNPSKEDLTYFIEVDHPIGCTSTDKKAASLNSSRSNRKTKLRSSVDNQAPTDISLDVSNIDENESIGSLVGRFTTTDPDEGDTHTYSLIAGTGGEDNSSFSITGDSLLSAGVFDYESKNTYSILVSTTDTFDLSFEKSFVITINDSAAENQAPTGISLDVNNIDENESIGSLVGRFTTTDPDGGDTHIYSLSAGLGSDDNSSFSIKGDSLLSAEVFDYETKNTYSILVSTTDKGGLSFEKSSVITINDVVEVGLNQILEQKIRIYPNPGTGVFNLSMDLANMDNVSIKIFDVSGKLVMTREYENIPYRLDTQFDLTGFADGIYQIHVRTSNTLLHRILIKE